MTSADALKLLRRTLGDVDGTLVDLTDEQLYAAFYDALNFIILSSIAGFDALSIGYDSSNTGTYGIIPEPSIEQAYFLSLKAAANLLREEFRLKITRGELGMSWSSGLEAESTISAAKGYQDGIDRLESQFDRLLLVKNAPITGIRIQ